MTKPRRRMLPKERFHCGKKVPYKLKRHAETQARRLFLETGNFVEAYRCKKCKNFHVGHDS